LAQFEDAKLYKIIVTNYAMWASMVLGNAPAGSFSAVVCDEAHMLDSALDSAFSVRVTNDESRLLRLPSGPDLLTPSELQSSLSLLETLKPKTDEDALRLERNKRVWGALLGMRNPPQIVLRREGEYNVMSTLWPAPWFRYAVRKQTKAVILTSATISEVELTRLFGLQRTEFESYDYPCPFDPRKGPVCLLPRGKMNHAAKEDVISRVFKTALDIAKSRPGTRGIVHTVSHARAQKLIEYAALNQPDVSHRLTSSIEAYLSSPDAVLVSASVGTGHDFPDDLCRWQVVVKAPYPNLGDPVVKLRSESDPGYMQMVMLANLTQICGRNVRHEDDYGETFVLDTNACDALSSSGTGLVPDWLQARVRRISSVPRQKPHNNTKE
jgi:Rad3-related DNA helicase